MNNNTSLKRKGLNSATSIIVLVVGLMLCILEVGGINNAGKIDDLVLLEKRNPGYWEVRPESGELYSLPEGYAEQDEEANLFVPEWGIKEKEPFNNNGISVVLNSDGTITLNGKNNGDDFNILSALIRVPDGKYIISGNYNGNELIPAESGASIYVWSLDEGKILNGLPYAEFEGRKRYSYGIHVDKGAEFNHYVIYPMVRLFNGDLHKIVRYRKAGNMVNCLINKADIKDLDKEDVEFYVDYMHDSTMSLSWRSIIFDDGNGVTIEQNKMKYGAINEVGYIYYPQEYNVSAEILYDLIKKE